MEGKGRKEGEGGQPATNLWLTGHAWPPLNSYFHPPLHFAPIMFTPKRVKKTFSMILKRVFEMI
jgi:hypothetical protein